MKPSLFFSAALILILMVFATAARSAERVRIGLSAVSPTNWVVWVGEERGLFRKYGLDPQVIFIGGGAARGANALIAKEVQFMCIGGVGVIGAALRGLDMVMVASNVNLSTQQLIAKPEIKSADDLRGKRVGVTAFGSNTHSVLLMQLKRWSMKPEDMTVLQIGPSPTMLASLEKGFIDAAVMTSPSDFIADEKGFRVLADMAALKLYSLQGTIATTREYLAANDDQATRFIRAFGEAIAFIKKNKQPSIDILRKKMRLEPAQDPYAEKTYARWANVYLERVPHVSLQGVRTLLDYLDSQSPKAKTADPQSFIDGRIVRQLESTGFFAQLYQ